MLAEYGFFLAKTLTIVLAIIIVFGCIISLAGKNKEKSKDRICVKKLNDKYKDMARTLQRAILRKADWKKLEKQSKKEEKSLDKEETPRKRVFVVHFHGDVRAAAVKALREEINAILLVADHNDEVVLCLESPGGIVPGYGLAAAQLQRLRKANIHLTVIVDKIAASGGYMMACVANQILAAPLAILGSIGVIAQIPNFHRFLKKRDIEFEQIMAGEYKRTLTLFGENTEKGREKLQQEVNETQKLFKEFVFENRPQLDLNRVATGEHWYGTQALDLKLVDGLLTSDDYLLQKSKHNDLFEICYKSKKPLVSRFAALANQAYNGIVNWVYRENSRHP